MKEKLYYNINLEQSTTFHNNATFCIGTGRLNLALRTEYHNQLKKVQEDIHFDHIRGHGLFCDDMAVYRTYEEDGIEKAEYNFSYIDLVFDDYRSMGLKPFVELGFMPKNLASGEQTIFYWKGNTTPPKDYQKWADLVIATIKHWISRYGIDEVITWPFEVWNEPNLPGFWKGADMEEYFKLYEVTSKAVKSCDPRIRVGGPAICGVDDERWLRCFLEFCSNNRVPIDFVTRHAYATEMPERVGHYEYQELRTPKVFMDELRESRKIIDSFPEYKGMEMHITEFNTSYTPLNPIHDTNLNAAYVARLLSEMGDVCASYSYWTFGDVFEEAGVAYTPFSGCFGLMTNGMIPKPTYWSFSFFSEIGSDALAREEHFIITKDEKKNIHGIAWNPVEREGSDISLSYSFDLEPGEYLIVTKLVDESTCNPLKTWIDMGSPAYPSAEQIKLLQECSRPQVRTMRKKITENTLSLDLTLSPNALCYFSIQHIEPETDRGYQPERIRGAR
ncbi:xylan 1,4-beta-xylosidase [Lachnospiraceae bacterium MD1]|jgi:xylan 1,4-beta-xylosidase|uniref:Xylan 1,4-beta-xylosidase n=1 Tax=Variimorphobacter saccharofermentans TaxID=2755051 RepID=A0A839K1W3_9FIRM|nr:xylan 1,4-beta-xylosidase [Variimorphobacter saccharofermentans]MBB2183616.1 xylan 1,4-beta-xylosidase [Variimorphobacter saccharofermentans]